jgi:glycolate oxidase iron-sulfur subunit
VADFSVLSNVEHDKPQQQDLDKCVHCGLCLNACPTYRELGVEMDSPRGRIYQMVQVAAGAPITEDYRQHMSLCLACRACETACPSGVPYGRLIEAARADLQNRDAVSWPVRMVRDFVYGPLLRSHGLMTLAGTGLWMYQASGLQKLVRASGLLKMMGRLGQLEALTPQAQVPFFFRHIGQVYPPQGERRYKVAFLAGCIQNISFARLNEATVRVLQKNGCEVHVPKEQNAGMRDDARRLARRNIDVMLAGDYDAIISNTGGCGSTLKEYHELFEHEPDYAEKSKEFVRRMRDVNEFLGSIELNREMQPLNITVTYQDSCHLAHGQKIRKQPRQLLNSIPGLKLEEMVNSDLCCGSAGVYNVVHTGLAMEILQSKFQNVERTKASVIASSNPGCMLQMETGARLYGSGQKVMHVVELLDAAYTGGKLQ